MKSTVKIAAMLLLFTLVLSSLASCGNTSGPEDGQSENQTTAAASPDQSEEPGEVTTEDLFRDVNFGNTDFNFFVWKQSIIEYYGDDSTGDMIESAVFKRNAKVEEKLGVNFGFTEEAGNSSSFSTFVSTVLKNEKSGLHEYDALACYTRAASSLMVSGGLRNMMDVDYLDFSHPWWPASLAKLNTIQGKLYFSSGDIASSLLYQMMFMILNNDLATDLGISGVQEKALQGEWTLDYLIELTKDVYADKTGGVTPRDPANRYGLYTVSHTMLDIFYMGAGLHYVEIDADGNAAVSEDFIKGDISFDIIDKLKRLYWSGDSSDGFFSSSGGNIDYASTGNALFYVINGENLQKKMSQATYNYSIMPAPKYNLDQQEYSTAVGFPYSMYCIPTDAENLSMSGAVLEMLAMESYNEVSPVIFDTAFKYKYSNSAGDATVFDIIRSSVSFDFGRTMFDQLGGDSSSPIRIWRNEICNNTSILASQIKTFSSVWKKGLNTNMNKITALQ